MKGDLMMWLEFLTNFNGVSLFRDPHWASNADVEFFTDAAASIGLGIYVQVKWAQARWGNYFPAETAPNNITFLELFPVVAAVHMFGDSLSRFQMDVLRREVPRAAPSPTPIPGHSWQL